MEITFPKVVNPVFREVNFRDQPFGNLDPAEGICGDDIENPDSADRKSLSLRPFPSGVVKKGLPDLIVSKVEGSFHRIFRLLLLR